MARSVTLPEKLDVVALAENFKAGAIPKDSDFSTLIDIAGASYEAVGKLTDAPGAGLTMSGKTKGVLEVRIGSGVAASVKNGVSIPYGNGLKMNGKAIQGNTGNGLVCETSGISLNVDPHGSGGLYVKDNTLVFKNDADTFQAISNALSVKHSKGINVDTDGVSINHSTNLAVNQNNQLTLSEQFIKDFINLDKFQNLSAGTKQIIAEIFEKIEEKKR